MPANIRVLLLVVSLVHRERERHSYDVPVTDTVEVEELDTGVCNVLELSNITCLSTSNKTINNNINGNANLFVITL